MIYVQQLLTEFTFHNIDSLVDLYDETKIYSAGELARVGSWQYKSVIDNNQGNYPLDNLDSLWYDRWAVANDYAMLDLYPDTKTEWAGDGVVEFERLTKDTIGIGKFKATEIRIDYLDDISGVENGLAITTSVDLNSTISAGTVYVNLQRFDTEDTLKTFTASKDTYVDIDTTGAFVYTEVNNGDPAPTLTDPNQRIAKVVTDADNITSVTDLRTVINPILDSDIFTFSPFLNMYNRYLYIYGGFTDSFSQIVYYNLKRTGKKIRVTFSANGNNTNCGFMVAGIATDMGCTNNEVVFPDKRIGNKSVSVANFKTTIAKNTLIYSIEKAKSLINESMMFVIDPSENSSHNNMVLLGKIKKVDGTASNQEENTINWEVEQNLEE